MLWNVGYRCCLFAAVTVGLFVVGHSASNRSILAQTSPVGEAADRTLAAERPDDPTLRPSVTWMLEPVNVPNAEAKTEAAMKPYSERISGTDVGFDMVPISGGSFEMGSPASETDRAEDEGPQQKVELDSFWMGK